MYIFNMASGNKNSVLSALQDVSVEKPGKQDKNGTQINKNISKKEYCPTSRSEQPPKNRSRSTGKA